MPMNAYWIKSRNNATTRTREARRALASKDIPRRPGIGGSTVAERLEPRRFLGGSRSAKTALETRVVGKFLRLTRRWTGNARSRSPLRYHYSSNDTSNCRQQHAD